MSNKSISFLLGAGFSAPMGYPVGNKLNEGLLNFNRLNVCISPDGKLFECHEDLKQPSYWNPYIIYLNCCIKLIEEYSREREISIMKNSLTSLSKESIYPNLNI